MDITVSLSGLCLHYIVSFVNLLNIGSTAVQEVLNQGVSNQCSTSRKREGHSKHEKKRGGRESVCVCVCVCVCTGGGPNLPIGILKSEITRLKGQANVPHEGKWHTLNSVLG